MSSLAHHGVKGQKWGVRRFQNPDGTRTALGKKQLKAIRLSRNEEGIRQVYRSLSDRDLNLLGYEKEEIEANRKDDFKDLGRRHTDYDQYNRVRYKNGDAVGYIAATGYQTAVGRGKKIVNILAIDLAVNSNYRGQGYSVELGKDIVRWFDRYGSKEYDRMEWYAKSENIASQKAAERSGFERRSKKDAAQGWVKYSYKGKKVKHSSIGGNMNYIYGNTLVLGDSSYLEHHGTKGQKWGVRRFQNPDGSLTAAGRIRYGVTGAAKAAFKAGKKLGAATASAARAGVKKAKDDAYAKKKEKASQTREGVLKNKKMFTNEELKRLEERFKIEDDMRDAGLRHGQEVAKTISAYGDAAVKTMNALQNGGKAVKAISDGLSAVQDYKEKLNISKKASDAGMSTSDYKDYTKSRMDDKAKRDNERAQKRSEEAEKRAAEYKEKQAQAKAEAEAEKNKQIEAEADEEVKRIMNRTKTVAENIGKTYLYKGGEKTKTFDRVPDAKANQNESLNKQVRDVSSALTSVANQMKSKTNQIKANNPKRYADSKSDTTFDVASPSFKKLSDAINASNTNKVSGVKATKAKNIDVPDEYKPGAKKPKLDTNETLVKNLSEITKAAAKNLDIANDKSSDPSKVTSKLQSNIEALTKKMNSTSDSAMRKQYTKLLSDELSLLDDDDFNKFLEGKLFKHSDIYSDESLSHYGVLGMKWGKHIMKGKGSLSVNDSEGGGGGAPEEDEEEENLFEYSTENNMLLGKGHYNKSFALQKIANENKADLIAARKAAQNATSDADALEKKVKSVNIFNDRKGYLISEQRAKDKKRVKELRAQAKASEKEAAEYKKALTKNSKKALNEYNKWQKSPSGYYDNKMKKNKRVRHSDYLIEDGTLYLCHHGIKGQRWGVRRFQNPDGTLTPRGRKKLQKKVDKLKRKQVASDNLRGTLERKHPYVVAGSAIVGAITGAAAVGLFGGSIAAIAAGAAICSAIESGGTHGAYTVAEAWEGRGSRMRKKKIAKYENMLRQDGFQIQNGVLIYGFDRSDELEHFGLKGMKWGVRRFQNKDGSLTEAGKQRYANTGNLDSGGGGGGGAPEEEDEELKKKIEEAAKKAGMTVDEYRKKFADKVAEIKKKTSGTTNAVGKFLNDIGSDKITKSFSKQSYESASRNTREAEDYKRKAASAANAGDKYKSAEYNKQAARLERTSKQQHERGKKWGDLYRESTVKGRAKSAASAAKTAAKKASEAASDAKYEVGYHAENVIDAVTGQRSKRQAKAWTETARDHEKYAEQAKARYISGTRKPDSFEGGLRKSNNAVAARRQEDAKEAREQAARWRKRYNRSLAGRGKTSTRR